MTLEGLGLSDGELNRLDRVSYYVFYFGPLLLSAHVSLPLLEDSLQALELGLALVRHVDECAAAIGLT